MEPGENGIEMEELQQKQGEISEIKYEKNEGVEAQEKNVDNLEEKVIELQNHEEKNEAYDVQEKEEDGLKTTKLKDSCVVSSPLPKRKRGRPPKKKTGSSTTTAKVTKYIKNREEMMQKKHESIQNNLRTASETKVDEKVDLEEMESEQFINDGQCDMNTADEALTEKSRLQISDLENNLQRQRLSRRCKDDSRIHFSSSPDNRKLPAKQQPEEDNTFLSEDEEDQAYDSDSDPAWMPGTKVSENSKPQGNFPGEEKSKDNFKKRWRGTRKKSKSQTPTSRQANSAQKSINTVGLCRIKYTEKKQQNKEVQKVIRKTRPWTKECRFKPGDFTLHVDDKLAKHPPIWRIEGKTLLQRFEPYNSDGKVLYKNSSSYTSWNLIDPSQYIGATVRLVSSTRDSAVVELLEIQEEERKDNTSNGESDSAVKKETESERESFEIVLQALLSQVLDSNFMNEITTENDEYFLSCMKRIEDVSAEKMKTLLQQYSSSLNEELCRCAELFPSVNTTSLKESESTQCQVCRNAEAEQMTHFYGHLYDPVTLSEDPPVEVKKPFNTLFPVCSQCLEVITLYNKLYHHKFNFLLKCRIKVSTVRAGDESKASSVILEECLEDTSWVSKMYGELVEMWNKCEKQR
ncbi:uncharacterized protein LOC106458845 isoform X2 [Limulus polyphemus]|uniref:Uncharacterized protein LOC106458845 isoform X2 n=1 Tax=Limulus polyphemus TaxID=6850 RepID=A0ABM1B367_LIMPO|nr:uncharacterized protein LOC106458845 isoform X2 [Limulus polyphemus]